MMTATMPDLPQLSPEPPSEPLPKPSLGPEEPVKKRGRPKAGVPETAPPPPPGPSPEDVAAAQAAMRISFKAAGILAAGKWGKHWLLQDEELDQLGAAWGTAVAPYLAKLGPAMPFVGALLVTGTILAPRVMTTLEEKKLKELQPMKDDSPSQVVTVTPIRQAEPPRR